MKGVIFIVFAVAIISSPVFAFSVTAPTSTFVIPRLITRQIDIPISSDINEVVTANLGDSKPWVSLSESKMSIKAGVQKNVSLFISPFADTLQGLYKISVFFESLTTKELKKADVYVSIEKGEIINIEKIIVSGDLEPLGNAKIAIYVSNLKPISVRDVVITLNVSSPMSNLGTVKRTVERLDPDEEIIVTVSVPLDKFAIPGPYAIDLEARYSDEIYKHTQTFFVQGKAVMQRSEDTYPIIFGAGKRLKVANYGNKAGDTTIVEPISAVESVFYIGDAPILKGGNSYTWLLKDIQPGETRVVEYRIDYTPLFLFLIALAVIGWVYFFKLRTIRIKKYIMQKKKLDEGEEFTVAVEITNALGNISDVEVRDFVLSVFSIKDTEGPKPARKKSQAGTELVWKVRGLNRGEARIFTYKITPVFGIHGTITLPRASAIFSVAGKKAENTSFHTSIGLPPESPEEENIWNRLFKRK